MLKNYFKIAWRNLLKYKLFSFINIVGLGLAIPFALVSIIQVQNAYEFDNFHPYPEKTYRIITDVVQANGNKEKYALSPKVITEQLEKDYPFVEKASFVARDFEWQLSNKLKTIDVNSIYVAPSFFDLFGFTIEKGTRPVQPNSLVLSNEKAQVLFGTENPIGKTLTHPRYGDFMITGVFKDHKRRNTHLRSDVMVSLATYEKLSKDTGLTSLNGFSYVLLKSNASAESLDGALDAIASKLNVQAPKGKEKLYFRKQLVSQISPDFENLQGNSYVDSILDLSMNFAFALAIIILAGFNYINLTLARSLSRAKEVGIRKVAGARRHQLVVQFICEAVLIAVLALGLGFVLLKLIERFAYVSWFVWEVDNKSMVWVAFIVFTIFVGLLAGIIPARILSAFKPTHILKGMAGPATFGRVKFRNVLVVIQFVVSTCFIFLIINLYGQFRYMATDNTNFNRKNIYNLSVAGNYKLLQHDISVNKNVSRVGMVSTPFGGTSAQCFIKNGSTTNSNITANYYAANANFITNMNLQFIAGKNLPESNSDSSTNFVVVNEKALRALGISNAQEAIGRAILLNDNRQVLIQGVLKDFCYYVYQFAPGPLVLQYNPSQFRVLNIKTQTAVTDKIFREEILQTWKKYYPHEEPAFSNYEKEMYERYYPGEDMKFMGLFCIILFVIAVLGLLGIVTYHTEKRVKEIGIRKVMGASVTNVAKTLTTGFVKLIVVAGCIALPLGYTISYLFLQLFAFNDGVKTGLTVLMFSLVFSIALITVLLQSLRAAVANPVKTLRTE